MGVLDSAYKYEDQLANQWDLNLLKSGTFDKIKFKVTDVSFPFTKFDVARKYSGETHFKSVEEVPELTITLRESPDFSTYTFFKNWRNSFYDPDERVYKVFNSKSDYYSQLYDFEIAFYKSAPIAIPLPYVDINLAKQSFSLYAYYCKPVGLDILTLDYDGKPLTFSITMQPEYIRDYKY